MLHAVYYVRFLLGQQAGHGAWLEPEGAVGDRKLVPPQYSLTGTTTQDLNLTTTALTIITLTSLQGLPSVSLLRLSLCVPSVLTIMKTVLSDKDLSTEG